MIDRLPDRTSDTEHSLADHDGVARDAGAPLAAALAGIASPGDLAAFVRDAAGNIDPVVDAAHRRFGNSFVAEAMDLLAPRRDASTERDAGGLRAPAGSAGGPLHVDQVVGAAQANVARTIAANKAKLSHDPGFEQISRRHGLTGRGGAPGTVRLPASLVDALDELWDDSYRPDGSPQEQGGNLVRNYGGSYEFRREEGYSGDKFEPDYDDVGWHQELVGVAHTHPYENRDNEGASFSATDLAGITAEGEGQTLNVLRSGGMTFLVARTKEFDKLVARHEAAGDLGTLYNQIYDCYKRVKSQAEGSYKAQVEAAVIAVCNEFHLEYYRGQGDTLVHVTGPS